MKFGICIGFEKKDGKVTIPHIDFLKSCGFAYVELALNAVTALEQEEFESLKGFLKEKGMPCLACNCFMNSAVKMDGPEFSWGKFREYVDKAVSRAKELGCRKLVLGSAGSRNVPEGYDRGKAAAEFDSCLSYMAAVCGKAGIVLILEHLNRGESNLITSFAESADIAERKNSPSFKSILDTYHFCLEKEPLHLIAEKKDQIGHIHFARTLGRTYPEPEDFPELEPVLREIRKTGYQDTFSMECSFPRMEEEPQEYREVLERLKAFFAPDKIGRAMYLRKYKKYNCAQSVACAFCDEMGIDEETVFRLSEGFGGGISGMGSVCGAVSGMVMVAGALASTGKTEDKKETYREIRELVGAFSRESGTMICRDLKGILTGNPAKPCDECILDCVELLQERFGNTSSGKK